jgi:hypothetical protein
VCRERFGGSVVLEFQAPTLTVPLWIAPDRDAETFVEGNTVLLFQFTAESEFNPRTLSPLDGVGVVADDGLQYSLSVVLPVPGWAGLVLSFTIVVAVELCKERVPRFIALVEQLVGDGATEDGLEAVADFRLRDGVPDVAPCLIRVEVGLSSVVGDDVDEGGCGVEEFDQAHPPPVLAWGELEGVGARSFVLELSRHRRVPLYVYWKYKCCDRVVF